MQHVLKLNFSYQIKFLCVLVYKFSLPELLYINTDCVGFGIETPSLPCSPSLGATQDKTGLLYLNFEPNSYLYIYIYI